MTDKEDQTNAKTGHSPDRMKFSRADYEEIANIVFKANQRQEEEREEALNLVVRRAAAIKSIVTLVILLTGVLFSGVVGYLELKEKPSKEDFQTIKEELKAIKGTLERHDKTFQLLARHVDWTGKAVDSLAGAEGVVLPSRPNELEHALNRKRDQK